MIYILKPHDNANEILELVRNFLAERGMEIGQQKTKITASTEGLQKTITLTLPDAGFFTPNKKPDKVGQSCI